MKRNTCQYKTCDNDPEFSCKCAENNSFFCKIHIQVHASEVNNAFHDIMPNYIKIDAEHKTIFLAQCNSFLANIKRIRDSINQKVKETIEKVMKKAVEDFEYLRKTELLITESNNIKNIVF